MVLNNLIQNDYIRALVILLAIFMILRILVFITEKIILRIVKKTKTKLDDKVIYKINKPLSFFVLIIGIRVAILELPLKEDTSLIVSRVISTILIVFVFYLVYRVVDILIENWGRKWAKRTRSTLDDSLLNLSHRAIMIVVFVIALLYILNFWDIEITPLLASLGIAGIAVAFALQSTLGNIFGGVSLILDKTIKVGDVVFLDQETKGTVIDVGLRSTKIRTFDNELIIMPNGKLADMKILNIALPDPKVRTVIPFSVAYGSDVEKVKKIILNEISKIKGISKEPDPPLVRFVEMKDSSLLFKLYFYMNDYNDRFRAIDDANSLIYNALNKNKINIPFPQLDVHLKK